MITKEMVESLSSDITRKEYNRIVGLISDRTCNIWKFILKASKRKLDWWAFSNDVEYGNGNGSSGGEFDPETDFEFIEIIGNTSLCPNPFYPFNDGFPTEYLWLENYQDLVKKEIAEAEKKWEEDKGKKLKQKQDRAVKKKDVIAQIKSKLTPEELKYVKFK